MPTHMTGVTSRSCHHCLSCIYKEIIQLLGVVEMVEGPGRPLFRWAGQYLTIWAWNQVKQPVAPDAAVSQTSDISHIHSTETAHFSPLHLCTSETWQMYPHSCTQNTNTRFPLCACAHTHMKSQIRASHLLLYVIKNSCESLLLTKSVQYWLRWDLFRQAYAALSVESSSLRHILLPDMTDIVQFVTPNRPTSIDCHHKVSLISSFQTELTGSQSLTPSEPDMLVLRGDRKQIETHWVSGCCPYQKHALQRAHPGDSITNYTVFSLLCLLSHSSLSSFQRPVKRRGIY